MFFLTLFFIHTMLFLISGVKDLYQKYMNTVQSTDSRWHHRWLLRCVLAYCCVVFCFLNSALLWYHHHNFWFHQRIAHEHQGNNTSWLISPFIQWNYWTFCSKVHSPTVCSSSETLKEREKGCCTHTLLPGIFPSKVQ